MNKADAVIVIIKEARKERGSRTGMERLRAALRKLAVPDDQAALVMRYMDYWDQSDQPYPPYRSGESK